jgi:SAM-dependent methyltransferase
MASKPQVVRASSFEFDALHWAQNYRRALLREFGPCLSGEVIEIGAGIGQITELLAQLPRVQRVLAVEPDSRFCAEFRQRLPRQALLQGTVSALARSTECDGIVSINVLEHIQEDQQELSRYASLLRKRQGTLCLFVPARLEIYAPLDKDFGHFRRYSKPELADKLHRCGFEVWRLHYYNFVGYFAWWLSFCLLRKRHFNIRAVQLFDKLVFPLMHMLESRIAHPPFGQSLLAVAKLVK